MNPIELKDLLDSIGPEDGTEASGIDPRWEDLTRGELDDVDVRRLGALAGAGGAYQVMGDLFEPLDEDFHHRTVDRLAGMLPSISNTTTARAIPAAAEVRPAPPPPVIVSPRPAEPWWAGIVRWLRSGWVMTPVWVAALALLFLRMSSQDPLPGYQIEVRGGDHQLRGAEDAPPALHLSPGSRVDMVLHPDRDVAGAVRAAAFRRSGAEWVEAGLTIEVSPQGAVRATGVVGEGIPATPGRVDLAIVITRGEEPPSAAWIDAAPTSEVVVVTTGVDIRTP